MSISSIAASSQVKAPEVIETKAPDVKTDGNADDDSASQPTVLAPFRRDRECELINWSERD